MEADDDSQKSRRAAARIRGDGGSAAPAGAVGGGGGEAGAQRTKKGPWSPWEDEVLVEYVRLHGERNWKEVAQRSGLRRCGKSCRLRWTNQLRPHLRKDRFTPSEEATILLLHSIHGNKWAKISAQLPGRTDNSIKNFMNTRAKRQKRQSAAPAAARPTIPSTTSFTSSQASSSAVISNSSSRAHPNCSSYHALMMATNHRMNYAAAPAGTTLLRWPLESTPASRDLGQVKTSAAMHKPTTFEFVPIPTNYVDDLAMLSATLSAVSPAPGTGTPDHRHPFDSQLDQLPAAAQAALYSQMIDRLPAIIPSTTASQPHGLQAEHAEPAGQFHSQHDDHQISGHEALAVQRPDQLPSVQYCNKSSVTSSFTDPLALLGGESVCLFKDADNLAGNMMSTCFSRPNIVGDRQSAHDDDGLIASSLISSCSQQLESSCCTASSSSTRSHHDYTLECIIKPLHLRRS